LGFHVPLFRRLLLLTPGVLGSGSSYVVSIHHRLLRPHAPVSQARCDFTPLRLYAAPSLCGNTLATRETFHTFAAELSLYAAYPLQVFHRVLLFILHACY